jgi:hypothetical protein
MVEANRPSRVEMSKRVVQLFMNFQSVGKAEDTHWRVEVRIYVHAVRRRRQPSVRQVIRRPLSGIACSEFGDIGILFHWEQWFVSAES